ncbi:hypothetical protein CPB83DRAFT_880389 [Crepidotus variabilis]|uniref:Uncharacterized protein n=1 Tax=Crepidotus variabilis TaxID=179855 RepID=A0A9P6EQM0_9AGAR|nr:hypothetical protein CPB83DRAFT_880389 [Crepidotus variabilis]
MWFCAGSGYLNFWDPCIQAFWSSILPTGLVFVFCLAAIPLPRAAQQLVLPLISPLKHFLTIQEAEALEREIPEGRFEVETSNLVPLWPTFVLAFVGTIEWLCWIAAGVYGLYEQDTNSWMTILPFFVALSWFYTIIRQFFNQAVTPPFDIFALYIVLFSGSILRLGGLLFDYIVFGNPLPSTFTLAAHLVNLLAILSLLVIILNMPLSLPSSRVNPKDIGQTVSAEDYTSLWGWITFSWIYPLIRRGRYSTLNEDDVWDLSPTSRSRLIFTKFSSLRCQTLLQRLWLSNSRDLIIDFVLTLLCVGLNYSGPFFLKRILDSVDTAYPTPESRTKAYIYAFLAFGVSLLKAQTEAQHLWYGRRASIRIRSELMASIYDKALKRKDYSGLVDTNKDNQNSSSQKGDELKDKLNKGGKSTRDISSKSHEPKAGADVGKIVNLMAGDTNRIARTVSSAYFIYAAPFEIMVAGLFLYQLLGLSAFAGLVVLVVVWPINNLIARRSVRNQKGSLVAGDKRMSVVNELISAIKFVKLFAWEEKWIAKTMDAREVEIKWITNTRTNQVFFHLLWTCAPIFVSIVSFFTYVMQGNELTIGVAFTAIALFNMVRAPLNVIPGWIVQIIQTNVALKRISVFLDEEEVDEQVSSLKTKIYSDIPLDEGFGMENASFKWNDTTRTKPRNSPASSASSLTTDHPSTSINGGSSTQSTSHEGSNAFELRDIDIKFPDGQLTVVTGPTASGKTALLLAVLGELTLLDGRILMTKDPSRVDENGLMHSISYCSQSPWLRHQSIKDNILFDYPYEEARYNEVVECCALKPDLEMLEDGDLTEIGARGVNLSGGQKARVALARAVYAQTKYVLLDDPLSAVDAHTSRFLYDKLILGSLLKNRTVVLVTHHVQLVLPGAFYYIRLLHGRVDVQGLTKDLLEQGLVEALEESDKQLVDLDLVPNDNVEKEKVSQSKKKAKKPKQLVKAEHRSVGGVKWTIYNRYLNASSYWTWIILALLVGIIQLLGIAEKLWLKTWGEAYKVDGHQVYLPMKGAEWPKAFEHPLFYVSVYAAIALGSALISVLAAIIQYTGALRASKILFRQLLIAVVRATFRFHDITPQGRMMNRFGKDIEVIDKTLVSSLQAVNTSLAGFFSAGITIVVVFPYFLIPAAFMSVAYRELALGYLNTGRDLRRMESNTRSPIFSHFGELLEGIVTVRAFSAEKRFLDDLHSKIDVTSKMWYTFWMTNRWLLLNFDVLGAISVLITTLFSISMLTNNAGLAGLCITSAMAFTLSVYWACRHWTTLELDLNAVERVVEYLDIPQEPPAVIEPNRVPAYWPSSSQSSSLLVVEKLEVQYAPDLPAVLNGISFALKAGERVGLLGRTGSGKSTLAMSILRFVDPSKGKIEIDGIDISTIGTHDLRSHLTFIPQDATLFSGTLRDNLNPFNEFTDAECIDALRRVHMINDSNTTLKRSPSSLSGESSSKASPRLESDSESGREGTEESQSTKAEVVRITKPHITLDSQVSAGGNNFSQGQRQLIAMARALLRRSSIIILDEATSSIDFETDAVIQATIREEFTTSLLLTVAHRLRTVIDYDRLIVLDKGQVVEFDTPWNLIQKSDGVFRNMCIKSGSFYELEAVARAASNT